MPSLPFRIWGAAGLTSSSFEMASKGGMGVELDLDHVPMREEGMTAYELMLSESQERMLMVLEPGKEDLARAIFEKWELDFAIIGKLTDTGRMVLRMHGELQADLPIDPLAEASPEYDRPWVATDTPAPLGDTSLPDMDWRDALKTLMSSPDIASRRWVWEQYDHMVMGDTAQRPGGDAAVVRIHGTNRGLAISTDVTPRYVKADPKTGGMQAVAEAYRNLTAVGAKPLAITDNLNFGNPEKPEIMGQIVGAIEGIGAACAALDTPVVSGNVSLYNETKGQAILPTPAIGMVGVIDDLSTMATVSFKSDGEDILIVGEPGQGWLGQSLYARECHNSEDGAPPPVNLETERKTGDLIRQLIHDGQITACHDISDGGLLVAVCEMALAGQIGADLEIETTGPGLFGEDQGRYVVTGPTADITAAATAAGVPVIRIGTTSGTTIQISGTSLELNELRALHEGWFPAFMAS